MLCALAPHAQGQHTQTSPEDAAFLNEVRENLSRAEQIAHRYSYKERRTDVHTNPFGRIGTGDTRVLEVYPSPNRQLTFRRVIERDGVPVPDAELREQEREYQQRATDIHARLSTEGFDARTARERDEAAARQRAKNRLDDILRVLVFNVKGHEVRNGVETVVVTFQGRPDAEPMTREGRMAKSFKRHRIRWLHRENLGRHAHDDDEARGRAGRLDADPGDLQRRRPRAAVPEAEDRLPGGMVRLQEDDAGSLSRWL